MKPNIFSTLLLMSALALVAACGGGGSSSGGGNVAGIGGTGITSVGTVTGFGSIFVNGVEYETNGAVFEIDDYIRQESDLQVGMVVKVEGTRDANGVTGRASHVEFDNQLEGPISGAISISPDGSAKTFTVIGISVRVDSTGTTFSSNGGLTFANITNGDVVEVSGFVDSAGVLNATFIARRAGAFQPNVSEVEARGVIRGLGANTFQLELVTGVSIVVDHRVAMLDDLPGGLADGTFVEVKGTLANGGATTIDATRIEGNGLDNDLANVSVEGIITDFNGVTDFKVAGVRVNAASAQRSPATLVLGDGVKVEVEGSVAGGVLTALAVEARGGALAVYAPVASVDGANNRVTLDLVAGTVTVNVNSQTRMEDSVAGRSPFTIAHINTGDFLEIEAFTDGTGAIVATRLKRESIDNSLLQGLVTAATNNGGGAGSVTILGVTFPTSATETDFEDANNMNIAPKERFFTDNGGPVGRLVRIKDDQPTNGIADEVEYRN